MSRKPLFRGSPLLASRRPLDAKQRSTGVGRFSQQGKNTEQEIGGAGEATDGKRDPLRVALEEQSEERFNIAIQPPLVFCVAAPAEEGRPAKYQFKDDALSNEEAGCGLCS